MARKAQYPSLPGGLLNVTTALASGVSLGDCEVQTSNLQDSAVTSDKINDGAVTASKLSDTYIIDGDSNVLTSHLADSAVTTAKIGDTQVTYAKIQNVTGARVLGRYDAVSGVVQEMGLAGGLSFDSTAGVLQSTLSNNEVDSSILANNAVSTDGLQDSAVTNAKLGDTAVSTSKINNNAVTYIKMQQVNAQKLLGRLSSDSGTVTEIALSAELRFDSDNDWLEVSDSGITASLMKDSTITSTKLADSAVTTTKISNLSVQTGKIDNGAVTASKLYDTNILTRIVDIHLTDTALTVGDTAFTWFVPIELNAFDLVRAEMAAKISSTTGNPTIQIRNVTDAADMLSTKITMDTGEKTSYTAATSSVVDTGNDSVVTGNEIAIDVDSAGSAEDVHIILSFRKP